MTSGRALLRTCRSTCQRLWSVKGEAWLRLWVDDTSVLLDRFLRPRPTDPGRVARDNVAKGGGVNT